jgi:hypothetical protein
VNFILVGFLSPALSASAGGDYVIYFEAQQADFRPIYQMRFEFVMPVWVLQHYLLGQGKYSIQSRLKPG